MEGKTRKLLEQIKKSNFANYPISNALLINETDYIKNNYFRHLALVLTQKGEVSENQRYLFSRLLVGANAESDIEEYLRQAFDIEIEQYVEFMNQMKEKELRYRFLLDATLITCCDAYDAEQQELLAAFMESLKMSLKEAEFLCAIGKSILEQDKKEYWRRVIYNENISFRNFAQEYATSYAGEYLELRDEKEILLAFPTEKEITKEFLDSKGMTNGIINGFDNIMIGNAVFDLSEEDLLVTRCKKVSFFGCKFRGGQGGINLSLNDDNEVRFENCTFTDFENRTIRVFGSAKASVQFGGCSFKKCYLISDLHGEKTGGVIGSKTACSFRLYASTFENCGMLNTSSEWSHEIILNSKAVVKDCKFKDCWGYSRVKFGDDGEVVQADINHHKYASTYLFAEGTVDEGNVIANSAPFYYDYAI